MFSRLISSTPIRHFPVVRSFAPLLLFRTMTRRTRGSDLALKDALSSIPPTVIPIASLSTTPIPLAKPSLITALEHIPPAPPLSPSSLSDDLTPPPGGPDEESNPQGSSDLPTEEEEPVEAPKRQRKTATPRKRATPKTAAATESTGGDETPAKVTPRKRTKKTVAESPLTDLEVNGDGPAASDAASEFADETPKKKKKKPTPKKSRIAKDEPEFDEEGNEILKKKRKPKVYPKIVYDIPDVERKETNFRGTSMTTV